MKTININYHILKNDNKGFSEFEMENLVEELSMFFDKKDMQLLGMAELVSQ